MLLFAEDNQKSCISLIISIVVSTVLFMVTICESQTTSVCFTLHNGSNNSFGCKDMVFILITPNILVAMFATTIKYLVYQKK